MVDQPKVDLLHISWCDSMWVPHLNASSVLDYFSERSNPFYSRDCNNEFVKMQQNARIDALTQMQGTEYMLLHAQDPILYIIRKQQRFSPTQVTPLASYHVIAGQVFQTPDIGTIINSRMASTINHLNSAFTELSSFSQYHPSKGYWWHFHNKQQHDQPDKKEEKKPEKKTNVKEEAATLFQRRRVESLLADLIAKYPYKPPPPPPPQTSGAAAAAGQDQPDDSAATAAAVGQGSTQVSSGATSNMPGSATAAAASIVTTAASATNTTAATSPPLNIKSEDLRHEDLRSDVKAEVKTEVKTEIKTEIKAEPSFHQQQRNTRQPPEKRPRLS